MRIAEPLAIPDGWKPVSSPPSLFKRYEFAGYTETRAFLDQLSLMSDESGIFPDLGFARTYVNVTLRGAGSAMPAQAEIDYAARANTVAMGGLP